VGKPLTAGMDVDLDNGREVASSLALGWKLAPNAAVTGGLEIAFSMSSGAFFVRRKNRSTILHVTLNPCQSKHLAYIAHPIRVKMMNTTMKDRKLYRTSGIAIFCMENMLVVSANGEAQSYGSNGH